ncbi:squalene synthase HpnC [Rhodoferax aquaticus]|uniref:Squalene synthase HpnC n=1 Tax=Rhodoferax aquaticus TaxID=2527691 RepID=A0A515EMW7_9BURK|nr:squalene synthase HpnC [Rhodoferax aquaticus]QDL54020.1 squalene synthase HpnC [Rhodoferax aquaticus]
MQRPSSPDSLADVSPGKITHYENFPVASLLCPRHLRRPIAAIYHFAREADDIADEGTASAEERLATLAAYRQALTQASHADVAYAGPWSHVFAPLQWAIHAHQLPTQLLHDLLNAFEQDTQKTRDGSGYADHAGLLAYCKLSANPVGRLLLHLYGIHTQQALAQSDAICSALQLINFWQDPSVDIPRGRYYLPADLCAQYQVSQAQLLTLEQTRGATQLIAACADLAGAEMQKGLALVHTIPGRAGWELRLVAQGGLRILDKIRGVGYATLKTRPVLRWWDFPIMLWRAVLM